MVNPGGDVAAKYLLSGALLVRFMVVGMAIWMCLPVVAAEPIAKQSFQEIWAYVMKDRQAAIQEGQPVTDLAFFAAGLSYRGSLIDLPQVEKSSGIKARRHLVLAEVENGALLHFVLAPEFAVRDKLVADLVAAAADWDGVQIDFEEIAAYDAANFRQFLALLKAGLGDKLLSVALPARKGTVDDAFAYAPIAALVDRVVVMAYDEHWSGSAPGPIASLAWSESVARHALETIGAEKLVMGLPLYGRVWADRNPTGAYRFTSIDKLRQDQKAKQLRSAEGIPYFRFSSTIKYTAWFEDARSVGKRAAIYAGLGIPRIGFWRLGLEDPAIWKGLEVRE